MDAVFIAAGTAGSCLGAAYFGFVAGVTRCSEFRSLFCSIPSARGVSHSGSSFHLSQGVDDFDHRKLGGIYYFPAMTFECGQVADVTKNGSDYLL